MDIVTGKARPDSGSLTYGEQVVSLLKLSEAQIVRAGVGCKFQRSTAFKDQTMTENLTLALKAARSPWRVVVWCSKAGDQAGKRRWPNKWALPIIWRANQVS